MIIRNQTSWDVIIEINDITFEIPSGNYHVLDVNKKIDVSIIYAKNCKFKTFKNIGFHLFLKSDCSVLPTKETVLTINECTQTIVDGYRGLSVFQHGHLLNIINGELVSKSASLTKNLKNSCKLLLRTIIWVAEIIVTFLLSVSLLIVLALSDIKILYKVFVGGALVVCIWELIHIVRFSPSFLSLLKSYLNKR